MSGLVGKDARNCADVSWVKQPFCFSFFVYTFSFSFNTRSGLLFLTFGFGPSVFVPRKSHISFNRSFLSALYRFFCNELSLSVPSLFRNISFLTTLRPPSRLTKQYSHNSTPNPIHSPLHIRPHKIPIRPAFRKLINLLRRENPPIPLSVRDDSRELFGL
jgi:hypothetical protein